MDINNALARAIGGDFRVRILLQRVIFGDIHVNAAVEDLLEYWKVHDDINDGRGEAVCKLIIGFAREYPFTQGRLAYMVASVSLLRSEEYSPVKRSFMRIWQETVDELAEEQHDDMRQRELGQRRPEHVREYSRLHQLLAQILDAQVILSSTQGLIPNRRLPGAAHALYAIILGLEDHVDTLGWVELDVTAAAQYFIHAGRSLMLYSLYHYGRREAAEQELSTVHDHWRSNGSAWRGEKGYSIRRWRYWRSQLERWSQIRNQPTMKAATLDAIRAMDQARAYLTEQQREYQTRIDEGDRGSFETLYDWEESDTEDENEDEGDVDVLMVNGVSASVSDLDEQEGGDVGERAVVSDPEDEEVGDVEEDDDEDEEEEGEIEGYGAFDSDTEQRGRSRPAPTTDMAAGQDDEDVDPNSRLDETLRFNRQFSQVSSYGRPSTRHGQPQRLAEDEDFEQTHSRLVALPTFPLPPSRREADDSFLVDPLRRDIEDSEEEDSV